MRDWEKILDDLGWMRLLFATCAMGSDPDSKAQKQYTDYVCTLVEVSEMVRERIREEDDGK